MCIFRIRKLQLNREEKKKGLVLTEDQVGNRGWGVPMLIPAKRLLTVADTGHRHASF